MLGSDGSGHCGHYEGQEPPVPTGGGIPVQPLGSCPVPGAGPALGRPLGTGALLGNTEPRDLPQLFQTRWAGPEITLQASASAFAGGCLGRECR